MTFTDNEVHLKRVLRVFRNAIVDHVRERLRAKFGPAAETQLASLYGKKEPGSQITQWDRMKLNADRARASPEVSTIVEDDFELLGVSDFFNLFERFFTELGRPAPQGEDPTVLADRKKGLLRCLQQVKVFRDPNAHDVSEPIDADSLLLCILNCKKVCAELELAATRTTLDALHQEVAGALATKHATLITVSDEEETLALSRRCLMLAAASVDSGRSEDLSPSGRFGTAIGDIQNVVLVVASTTPGVLIDAEIDALNQSLTSCERHALTPLVLLSHRLDEHGIEAKLLPAALRAFKRAERLPVMDAYVEATAGKLSRLLRPGAPRRARTSAIVAVATAQAVHDDKLAPILFGMMRDPQLTVARIVAPFATEVRAGALGLISEAMIEAKKRGCRVCLITRPPSSTDADLSAKKRLLQLLHDEEVELYVNPQLHAKVYLFERDAERKFWAVGSHNLTNFAHNGKSLETSMVGYRSQEFEEAQTSFERARRHTETLRFDAWQSASGGR